MGVVQDVQGLVSRVLADVKAALGDLLAKGEAGLHVVEADISNVIHHTEVAVQAAVAEAEKVFAAEEQKVAADVKVALKDVEAVIKADGPILKADIEAAIQAVLAALASHGL